MTKSGRLKMRSLGRTAGTTCKLGGQFLRQIIKTFYPGNNGELGFLDFDGRFTNASYPLQ